MEVNIERPSANAPYVMVGAGTLSSAIWKSGSERSGFRYRFNVFRQCATSGQVTQAFGPGDIKDLVKLAHLLAVVHVDDGCIGEELREELSSLDVRLRQVVDRADGNSRSEW